MLVGEGQESVEKTGHGRTYSVSFSLLFLKKNDLLKREMADDCFLSVGDYKTLSNQKGVVYE